MFKEYFEVFISWFPFYFLLKCIVLCSLLVPKANMHVVGFEIVVLPGVQWLKAYGESKIKPKFLQLAGMHSSWLHKTVMNLTLSTLTSYELEKLEMELTLRLRNIQVQIFIYKFRDLESLTFIFPLS